MLFYVREEIAFIRQKSVVLSVLGGLLFTSGSIATMISVTIMATTHNLLTPSNVFMMVTFMNMLRTGVSYYLAHGLQVVSEARVSFGRLQEFLMLEPLPPPSPPPHLSKKRSQEDVCSEEGGSYLEESCDSSNDYIPQSSTTSKTETNPNLEVKEEKHVCIVSHLTVDSNRKSNKYILRDISFKAEQKSLTVLSGPVGSGKSSVLSAIIHEVAISEGSIFFPGNIAYVSQTPWIFFGTVQENVLFGQTFDEEKYKTVIEACALQTDIESFPDGDQTIVGERGIVLSGGQQARISLARAVYADADVYLLDDPLSAVDLKVAQHIFQKCICQFLASKTRLFVSHQVSYMKMADKIVLLSKGQVLSQGSFTELKESGILDKALDIVHHKSTPGEKLDSALQDKHQENGQTEDKTRELIEMANDVPIGLAVPEEDRCIGTLSLKLYRKYFRAGIPPMAMVGLLMVFLLAQGILVDFCKIIQGTNHP